MPQTEVKMEHEGLRQCRRCSDKRFIPWIYGPCYQTSSEQEVRNSITQKWPAPQPIQVVILVANSAKWIAVA